MDLSNHPAIMVLSIAVVSSLLSEIRIGVRIPVAVWEILLGMILGPAVLGLASISHGELWGWFAPAGLAALLFMAGMDSDFGRVRGPADGTSPGSVAPVAWTGTVSANDSLATEHRPGTDDHCADPLDDRSRQNHSQSAGFGEAEHAPGNPRACCRFDRRVWTHPRYIFAPDPQVRRVVASYGPGWLHGACGGLCADRCEIEQPRQSCSCSRGVCGRAANCRCLSLLIVASFVVIAESIGFEAVVGSFSAGMVIGLAISGRSEEQELLREKMKANCFAVFVPFFFVMSGMRPDVHALFHSARSFMLVPVFLGMFVAVRGSPVLLHRSELRKEERLPFALYFATELPMVVAITEIGLRLNMMGTEIATALIGAGLLSVLLFPAIADAVLVPPPVQSETASATY